VYQDLTGRAELGQEDRYVSLMESGIPHAEIARALRYDRGSIRNLLAQRGGIGPSTPYRAKQALTLAEREDISRGIAVDERGRSIARRIGSAPST
jgi:hypothetical protein